MSDSSSKTIPPAKGGPPAVEMSREEVMAQRAAKKKEKEARKNKSGGGASALGGSSGDKGVQPEGVGKEKQQKKPEVTPGSASGSKSDSVSVTASPAQSGPPGGEMSREEVMAQRAAKKKEKEARKNKSGGGADGSGDKKGKEEQKPKQAGPESQGKSKPPQQQASKEKSKEGAGQQQSKVTASPSTPVAAASKSKTEDVGATTTATKGDPKSASQAAAAVDEVKLSTPTSEKVSVKSSEYQSTIQSLFRPKRTVELGKEKSSSLHPLFHNLGVKLRNNVIRGTNMRCVQFLHTLKDYVESYETPAGSTLKHGLSADLKYNLDTLRRKCPFAIGMNNAVDFVNAYLYKLQNDSGNDVEQKRDIIDMIDQYIEEKIEKAVEAIVFYGLEKIKSGDVIMIYSITEAVLNLLEKAAEEGNTFELIIIQTPENMLDIPILLDKLGEHINNQAVTVSSVNFSNAIYRMRHCSKVIIGGHGLFTTGGVMAQSGSGKLALIAATFNKPAIFLCETYKFCDRSPLDFFTLDEYVAEQSQNEEDLFEPKIKYDVTPANLVTVVITDIDMLPSTSVPAVLRVQEDRAPRKNYHCIESQ